MARVSQHSRATWIAVRARKRVKTAHGAAFRFQSKPGLSGNREVDRLRALALLVRFDLERNALSFGQILQPSPLYCGDVNEHIAAAIVGLDEDIAAFSVEELDRTTHGHRGTPPPYCSAATHILRVGPTGDSLPESLATCAD